RSVEDRCIEAFAGDLLQAGARPAQPRLASVLNDGNGRTVSLRWDGVAGADGYYVYYSRDLKTWDAAARFYTTGTTFSVFGFAAPETVAFRVTAVSAAGESDPSNAYAARCDASASAVLIVDGNTRWQREKSSPENVRGASHAFTLRYAAAIAREPFDTCARDDVRSGAVSLAGYAAVIWACGQDGAVDHSYDAGDQATVGSYLAGGGSLLSSGSEIAWDLDRAAQTGAGYHDFCERTLRETYVADDSNTYVVRGSGGIFAALPLAEFRMPGGMTVASADVVAPANGSAACLEYVGGAGGAAAVQYAGGYRLVGTGFPLECLSGADDRAAAIDAVLRFFGL
ncbi:MAG TPA: fibronectin type III domain-containing protein, partial [Planctomycetota bacterium]|nr:fibronectin type III domain-containing protein [Planctomycetota bacterium]